MESDKIEHYTDRMCSDCVHCDIVHDWCYKRSARTSPLVLHPKDRSCPDYYDLFDAARDGWFSADSGIE